jgi:hypothetical protein
MRNISLQIASAKQEAPDWSSIIEEVKELIPSSMPTSAADFGDMIQDAIDDAMGQVQMPTAMDHIAGFASMFLQQKLMQGAPPIVADGLNALNEHATESFTHGPPSQD